MVASLFYFPGILREWNIALLLLTDYVPVMKNPANLAKHQANPKVAPIIAKMMAKFAGPQ